MTLAVWWIRRDLRLRDNQALASACAQAGGVLPVFVLDPALLDSAYAGEKRLAFLFHGLRVLDAALRERGSRLILRRGDPKEELGRLLAETGAGAICAEEDVSPYARRRDARVAADLPLRLVGGRTVHPPEAVLKSDGRPYLVFTPFSRTWKALPRPAARSVPEAARRIATPADVPGLPIPEEPRLPPAVPFVAGEAAAWHRLQAFVTGERPAIARYATGRDLLSEEGTSQLSPYLRLGMLSARQAVAHAWQAVDAAADAEARRGAETWLDELIWREFYAAILFHLPRVRQQSFRANLADVAWHNDEAAFAAWCQGRTGYPVVDAALRQLVQSGWIHNRARMIGASFLVKDLLVDWRWGERFFMQHLVDGDPAANNGGWQWVAGTGTDAAPYFRIFNPVLQGTKYDPRGVYVRRWLPELARVPDRFVHAPWEMPLDLQRQVNCVVGQDYAAPIVDHAWARKRTMEAFARAREDVAP